MTEKAEWVLFEEAAQDKWEHDVWLMARRMAMLYHYFADEIIKELGDERGRDVVKKAVWQYGTRCGKAVREGVQAAGRPVTLENFRTIPDLPSRGWRSGTIVQNGKPKRLATLCPLARTWFDIGTDPSVARIYCFVDQSKIEGYGCGEFECVHAQNVLDGDPGCDVVFRPVERDNEGE